MTREEQIIQAAKNAEKEVGFNPIVMRAKGVNSAYGIGFLEGAEWADAHLWHPAEGDDLPELEREVVVFTQKEGLSPKVGIAHRPDPKGWDGTNISTGKTEHFEPMLYGKGGWSLPDVKIWLDAPLPFKEGGEE